MNIDMFRRCNHLTTGFRLLAALLLLSHGGIGVAGEDRPLGDDDAFARDDDPVCAKSARQTGALRCGSPQRQKPLKVKPRQVNEDTTQVAALPRPPRIEEERRHACPHHRRDLVRWNQAWLGPDGVAEVPPGTHALVRGNDDIPAGTLVRTLHVPAGSELVFADQAATFRVTDVRVEGALRLGSPTCRLKAKIEFEFDTSEDVADDAVRDQIHAREGLGIVVEPGGVIDVFGRLYQPTWTRLARTAVAGAGEIRLAEAVDWEPGQQLVVVTSELRDYPYTDQNEVRTIVDRPNGRTLRLDAPLAYLHYGGPEYQVEVGLLTRSIVFRTADALRAKAPTFGGHVMFHDGGSRISGAEFVGLGQQNYLGRYPLHMHFAGDVAGQSYITDNSIWRSNWRCIAVHRSFNAIISRNVAFDAFGHCFYLEDGVETGNEFSYNLAARVKIMGPVDQASIDALNVPNQDGFVLLASPEMVNPADRAAAGFYITNGNNRIFGNAASGGFAGYSFPNLPQAIGGNLDGRSPLSYAINHFDGNSAHTAGYFWNQAGCVYAGGLFEEIDDNGTPRLRYHSGRETVWERLRHEIDTFSNLKTFLCSVAITHWGNQPRVVNLEAWDNDLMAIVFGSASVQSAVVAGATANTPNLGFQPISYFRRGFQFYDTDTQTVLSGIVFRDFHRNPYPQPLRSLDNCALFSMTHSDEFTPQQMNATARIFFDNVDEAQRFCHDDTGTLSSRNFNLYDSDGSVTRRPADGIGPGARAVGSAYTDVWRASERCLRDDVWGLWICPQRGAMKVAAINTRPNQGVRVTMYDLRGNRIGDNWYSTSSDFIDAQITGPAGVGWHHAFPGGVPEKFEIWALQVPDASFVLFSFTLPAGVRCSIDSAGWQAAPNLASLLAHAAPAYVTERQTCFIRVPPTNVGSFEAAGLSIPNQTWRGNPTPTTYFTVSTGCSANSFACGSVASTLPTLR